jgi:hypothetical protein
MADANDTNVADATTKPDGSATPKTYSEDVVKELIAARDAVKAKLREREDADKKAAEAKLLEEGKLKEALALKDTELAKMSGLEERLKKFEAQEQAQREKLLKELPKDKRELYASVSTEVLQDMVEQLKVKDATEVSRPGTSDADKAFEDFDSEEIADLKAKNPGRYQKLYREYYKKKNGRYPPV